MKRPKIENMSSSTTTTTTAATSSVKRTSTTTTEQKFLNTTPCGVCQGHGRLGAKKIELQAVHRPGVIRKARTPPPGWQPAAPLAYALQRDNGEDNLKWAERVRRADQGQDVVVDLSEEEKEVKDTNNMNDDLAKNKSTHATQQQQQQQQPLPWLPQKGEELVKLNGGWRILQRVGGHRWTTDDCVTAYVAVREIMQQFAGSASAGAGGAAATTATLNHQSLLFKYLDLGTGNASVLQMVLRALLQQQQQSQLSFNHISAKGIEARREAVDLARRSLLFNVGPDFPVEIVHGDFRDVVGENNKYSRNRTRKSKNDDDVGKQEQEGYFDLVTGTPPYFRVDFNVAQERVQSAVIRQGGMPTARQSAPARCEFRGGIEAYCQAASRVLSPRGRFVVCENYLNHDRVGKAARDNGLELLRVVKVQGRQGRKPLFCVYVMRKIPPPSSANNKNTNTVDYTESSGNPPPLEEEVLAVRDDNGNWTSEYAENVFEILNIPQYAPSADTSRN